MKKVFKLLPVLAIAGSLAAVSAHANSITVSEVSATGAGPSTWDYSATFVNSTVNPGDFFTINDFGPAALSSTTLPAGWVMSQAAVGPNSLPAADSPAVLNVTFTWTGAAGTVVSPDPSTATVYDLVLTSPGASTGKLGLYTSIDQAASGPVQGTDSRVIGFTTVPSAPPVVPDGGMTVALLGFAMVGVEGLRRRFVK